MRIDKKQIEEISSLARIKLTDEEKGKYIKQFESILEYFEQLKEVDTEKIIPLINANSLENIMREDKITDCDKGLIDNILEQVPRKKDKYIKVKKVL